ncbi:hypothetical protein B1H10_01960 [candidate division KSB1 bacterium 4484_188]|nr:MAG: hypothetical protein B1H10_01960 [candidate division KSB1 bacterium 4484_188]
MFHRKLVIWGILSAALVFGCSGEKLHSQPKMNKIEVDGRDADWSDYKTNYYEKENMRIVLGVVNDDSSINILIRFRDFRLARMFERRGVTLWLNSENKKKKTLGIHYINEASKYMAERQKLKEWMKEKGGGGMRGKIRGGAGGSRRGGRMGGGGMRGVAPGRQMPDIEGKEFWMTVLLSNRAVEKK